jgi:hypothetical protein
MIPTFIPIGDSVFHHFACELLQVGCSLARGEGPGPSGHGVRYLHNRPRNITYRMTLATYDT